MEQSNILGTNIRLMRQAQKKTGVSLAKEINISVGYLHDLEVGRTQPSIPVLASIARALNVSVDALMSPQEQKSAPVSQTTNEGDNVNVQFNSDNSHNSGTINQSVTTGRKLPQELFPQSPGDVYISLKKYNYSDVVKYGLSGAVHVGLVITDKENFADSDAENPPFAIVQNESFNLGRFGLQKVLTAVFTPVSEVDEECKFYLISYNGRTSVQRVRKIPPDAGYIIENDDGEFNISAEFAKSGGFTVIGKIVYTWTQEGQL